MFKSKEEFLIARKNREEVAEKCKDIEENLKEFVWSVAANERDEALLITEHAEYLSANHTKSNKDFAWDLWYESSTHDSAGYLWNSMHVLYEQINSGHAEQSVKNLKELFDKEKAKK